MNKTVALPTGKASLGLALFFVKQRSSQK